MEPYCLLLAADEIQSAASIERKLYDEVFPNFTDSIDLRHMIIDVNTKQGEYLNQFNAVLDELVLEETTEKICSAQTSHL